MIGLKEAPVTAWLVANVEGVTPPCRFTLIKGGHSNLTYRAKTWSQNLRACRSSRSTRPWLIVSVHVDAGFFPAAATGR